MTEIFLPTDQIIGVIKDLSLEVSMLRQELGKLRKEHLEEGIRIVCSKCRGEGI